MSTQFQCSVFERAVARLFACGFGVLIGLLCGRCIAQQPLNIVLIMADDLGWQDLSCQGNQILQTPAIDALASSGMRFSDAYAAAPVCSPTRGAIMTGMAPARLKITQHGADGPQFHPEDRVIQPPPSSPDLSLSATTVAEHLQMAGYNTGFFGKWHLGDPSHLWPEHQGFDVNIGGCGFGGPPTYFDPYRIPSLPNRNAGEYLTDRLADETIRFIKHHRAEPMFLCLWTYNPHYPFEAPEELSAKYLGKNGRGLRNPIYGGQIAALDRAVGRVLNSLEQNQIADRTLVIFTSDNGGWSGATDNHPLREGKGYLYEGGIRVPLLIRWPGVTRPNSTNSTPVISMDLTATILDAAGLGAASEAVPDGLSLRPLLTGDSIKRQQIFFHYPHYAFHKANRPGAAVRAGNHKLIYRFDDQSTELYDLQNDLEERNNLASQQKSLTADLRQRLLTWLDDTKAATPQPRLR